MCCYLNKAFFSNFVAIDYKIELVELFFLAKLTLFVRKEHANLLPTRKMALYTFNLTSIALNKNGKPLNKWLAEIYLSLVTNIDCFPY
jgi:hypothetical protein